MTLMPELAHLLKDETARGNVRECVRNPHGHDQCIENNPLWGAGPGRTRGRRAAGFNVEPNVEQANEDGGGVDKAAMEWYVPACMQ
jgi:hypothetical protein